MMFKGHTVHVLFDRLAAQLAIDMLSGHMPSGCSAHKAQWTEEKKFIRCEDMPVPHPPFPPGLSTMLRHPKDALTLITLRYLRQ